MRTPKRAYSRGIAERYAPLHFSLTQYVFCYHYSLVQKPCVARCADGAGFSSDTG